MNALYSNLVIQTMCTSIALVVLGAHQVIQHQTPATS